MKNILLQNVNSKEVRTVSMETTMNSSEYNVLRSSLENIHNTLPNYVPVGSVEFCHAYAKHHEVLITPIDTYPSELHQFLKRDIVKLPKHQCDRTKFLKPVDVKLFTGFIGETDEENQTEFDALPENTILYQSDEIDIVSEYRYYISNKTIVGYARYDQNDYEDCPKPSYDVVFDAVSGFDRGHYAIDFGVLRNGETVLIEVNNCYAIGLYQEGNMTPSKYLQFLIDGWESITYGESN